MHVRKPSSRWAAALVLAAACAHADRPSAPAPPVVWPEAPAAPAFKLGKVVSTASQGGSRSWWAAAWSWIAGTPEDSAGDDALARPFDVAWEPSGGLVVADPDRRSVARYGPDGAFVADVACPRRPWSMPMSVVALPGGAVLVADAGAAAIVQWSARGCQVLRDTGLQRPTGLAASDGRILVADPPAHQVVALSPTGEILARWGERGDGDGQFLYPTDVALAPDGSIYVVDSLNFRIVHLAADGRWLGAFGAPGEQGAGLARPKGISVDPTGRIYVSDAQRDVVLVFRGDDFLFAVGAPGNAPGYFAHPAGLAMAGRRLAVADSLGARVQVFESVGDTP